MNNQNVKGHTYAASLLARYSQSLRHALGVSSTAYLLRHMLTSTFSPRKYLLFLLCLESHSLPLLYFVAGIHVLECAVLGEFRTYFHDEKLLLFGVLTIASTVLFNISFGIYKAVQFYLRRRVFGKPRNVAEELVTGLCDMTVQAWSAIAYFIIPFGFRTYQNLVFWTNTGYYNKFEEKARKY